MCIRDRPGSVPLSSICRDTLEPTIFYIYESANCKVPPAKVMLPSGIIQGTLLWGGLSPVLNIKWLRWRRITLVVNCMGSMNGTWPDPNYERALQARENSHGIEYLDWSINHEPSRIYYPWVFAKIADILKRPGTCVYIHCKNGRDRSVATVFALLRLQYCLSYVDAYQALQSRIGKDGQPCANLGNNNHNIQWVERILSVKSSNLVRRL